MGLDCVLGGAHDIAKDQKGDQEAVKEVSLREYLNRIRHCAIGYHIEGSLWL
jgi:hypothetical protein